MKATPIETRIMNRMKPGVITLSGFLGSDPRNLFDIIAEDAKTLAFLEKDPDEIALRMQYFTDISWEASGEEVTVDDIFIVRTDVVRGKLPCPFAHVGIYRKAITTVFNTRLNIELRWTSLSIHLIKEHGFFEGKGSPFRLDPETLVKTLF